MHNTEVNMFEHLPEIAIKKVQTYKQLLAILPYIAENLIYGIEEIAKKELKLVGTYKYEYNKMLKVIRSSRILSDCEARHNPKYTENGDFRVFESDLADKLTNDMIQYMDKIVDLSEIPEGKYIEVIDKKVEFFYKLNKGDRFIFIDTGTYIEYTYDGMDLIDHELICRYSKRNTLQDSGVEYYEESNIYRAVIRNNFIEELKSLQHGEKR